MSQAQKLGYRIDEMVHAWLISCLLEMTGREYQWMCRWVGMTLLYMHKVFPTQKGEADDHDIIR